MIKRFNPDFSLSISHELAYMRETPEGGYVAHGDYATLFSELEALKADRDALADRVDRLSGMLTESRVATKSAEERADALAVENAELKSNLMFWDADNPESPYDSPEEIANDCSLDYNDEFDVQVAARLPNRTYRVCEVWDCDCKLEIVEGAGIETPATDAALAAIRAQAIEDAVKQVINVDTVASTVVISQLLRVYAAELREAK